MKREFTLKVDGEELTVTAERQGDTIRVTRGDDSYDVVVVADSIVGVRDAATKPTGTATPTVSASSPVSRPKPNSTPSTGSTSGGTAALVSSGVVYAPMTGVIDQVIVSEGTEVEEGATIVVLEAMKMYIDVVAPLKGKVDAIHIAAGDNVKEGQALLTIT